MYLQVYLFKILYSYWIATNIIQYLPYLVMIVSEYLCIHSAISEKMGSAIISKNYATFPYKYKDVAWGRGYSHTKAW